MSIGLQYETEIGFSFYYLSFEFLKVTIYGVKFIILFLFVFEDK